MKTHQTPLKVIFILACAVFFLQSCNKTYVEKHGQLSVSGTQIVDQSNEALQLQGMSFFWSQWMGKYYNAQTVKWLREDWKCNVVRAAMGIEMGGYLENPNIEKKKVYDVVDAAIQNGIYVIVDWHDHHAQHHTEQAKEFFAELAQKYGDKPNLIYEIYNRTSAN